MKKRMFTKLQRWLNLTKFFHPPKNVPNHYPENYPPKEKYDGDSARFLEESEVKNLNHLYNVNKKVDGH